MVAEALSIHIGFGCRIDIVRTVMVCTTGEGRCCLLSADCSSRPRREADCSRHTNGGARSVDKARQPSIFPACAKLVFIEIAIFLKLIGKVSTCHWLTNCLVLPSV